MWEPVESKSLYKMMRMCGLHRTDDRDLRVGLQRIPPAPRGTTKLAAASAAAVLSEILFHTTFIRSTVAYRSF
jgi:hypothetical protein